MCYQLREKLQQPTPMLRSALEENKQYELEDCVCDGIKREVYCVEDDDEVNTYLLNELKESIGEQLLDMCPRKLVSCCSICPDVIPDEQPKETYD